MPLQGKGKGKQGTPKRKQGHSAEEQGAAKRSPNAGDAVDGMQDL